MLFMGTMRAISRRVTSLDKRRAQTTFVIATLPEASVPRPGGCRHRLYQSPARIATGSWKFSTGLRRRARGRADLLGAQPRDLEERHVDQSAEVDDHPVRLRCDPAQSRPKPEVDQDPAGIR